MEFVLVCFQCKKYKIFSERLMFFKENFHFPASNFHLFSSKILHKPISIVAIFKILFHKNRDFFCAYFTYIRCALSDNFLRQKHPRFREVGIHKIFSYITSLHSHIIYVRILVIVPSCTVVCTYHQRKMCLFIYLIAILDLISIRIKQKIIRIDSFYSRRLRTYLSRFCYQMRESVRYLYILRILLT